MKKVIGVIAIYVLILLVLVSLVAWFYFAGKYPLTSPLKSIQYFASHKIHPHVKMQKEAIGFLPYWRVTDSKYTRQDLITEINYFGLYVNGDGKFITVYNGETNPGKREWESQAIKDVITKTHIFGNKFTLSIICQDNDDIKSLLDSKNAQSALITSIINEVKSRKLDGINIDFEYTGTPDLKYQQKFTDFSNALKSALYKVSPETKLEVSIMPSAARSKDIFDFSQIVPIYDNFIGMSYDYYGGSSVIAGPIAPMEGYAQNKYFFDVKTMYENLGKYVPKDRIVMGVPHYGWDWAVEDGKKIQSTTLLQTDSKSYAAVVSYARALEDKNLKKAHCQFDDYALEPWCWYTDPKTKVDHQVWFENTRSIGIKYDFANKNKFAGIAIWVLGYDKDYPDLWNLMRTKFSSSGK